MKNLSVRLLSSAGISKVAPNRFAHSGSRYHQEKTYGTLPGSPSCETHAPNVVFVALYRWSHADWNSTFDVVETLTFAKTSKKVACVPVVSSHLYAFNKTTGCFAATANNSC